MRAKRPLVLYISDFDNPNKSFYNFLKSMYNVKTCNYVLPNSIEKYFGNVKLSDVDSLKIVYESITKLSKITYDELIYKFGIDNYVEEKFQKIKQLSKYTFLLKNTSIYKEYSNADLNFGTFILTFRAFLQHLGMNLSDNKTITEIIGSKKSFHNYITEDELLNFDLIILDNLAQKLILNQNEKVYYVQYKIALEVLERLMRQNKKFLFFFNCGMNQLNSMDILRFNLMMKKLRLSQIDLASFKKPDGKMYYFPLHGFDNKFSINNNLNNFIINTKRINKKDLFYKDVNGLKIEYPLQFIPYNKDNQKDLTKILLSGNKDTTYLGATLKDSQNNDVLYKSTTRKKSVFGILDTDMRNMHCILSGNLNTAGNLNIPACQNKVFLRNVMNNLIHITEAKNKSYTNTLPFIELNQDTGILIINNKKVELERMELCYYLYFLKRAVKKEKPEFIGESIPYKKKNKDSYQTHKTFINKIYKIYEKYFLNYYSTSLIGETEEIKIPTYKTFTSTIYDTNQKIISALNFLDEEFLELVLINSTNDNYTIKLKSELIKLV